MRKLMILGTAVVAVTGAVVALFGPNRAQGSARTLRFYEHDTQQASIELGDPGVSPGDDFIFSGDLFDHKGGTKLGRLAGGPLPDASWSEAAAPVHSHQFVDDPATRQPECSPRGYATGTGRADAALLELAHRPLLFVAHPWCLSSGSDCLDTLRRRLAFDRGGEGGSRA